MKTDYKKNDGSSGFLHASFYRTIAKGLVLLMVIQALSLWELSRSYEWGLDRFFKCVGTLTGEAHASDLPFGTKKYVRTKRAPNVYEDTFFSTVGAGRLTILNGDDNGQDRVTSAIVWLNGIEIFSPHDFKKSTYHLERKIDLLVDYPNTLKLELRSKPGSFIVVSLETALVSIVPHVVGMTYASAQTDIIAAGLQVGTITTANSDTVPADIVISQEPAAGVSVKQGTVVDMVVSLGPSGPPPVNGVLLDGPPDALALEVLQNVNLISGIPPSGRAIDASRSEVSLISLLVKLAPQATVDQVSALLTKFGARIIWMIEDVPYLLLHIPNPGSVSGLDALVGELEATSVFEQVLRSYFPENAVLPQNFDPATHNQFEVIDHLIGIHAPAAWNASNALQGKQVPTFLIADEFGDGAPQDSSFAIATNPGDYTAGLYVDGHGYHVLGIVASDFEGDFPTGLLPSLPAPLEVSAVDIAAGNSWGEIFGNLMTRLVALANTPGERVILNTSLQFSCGKISTVWQCAPPNAQLWAMTWLTMVRARNLEDRFLHVTAAGNIEVSGDDDARTASPFAAAALLPLPFLEPNLTNTIVVENVVGSAVPPYNPQCLADTSKVGGHLSAVGTEVDSYVRPEFIYNSYSGTSMATPQVAALAAYVWALEPTLSPAQLKQLIMNKAREVTPPVTLPAACSDYLRLTAATPAPAINAYASVLAVDQAVALSEIGNKDDASVRSAILDVADTTGAEGADGIFDQGDLMLFKEKILQGVGAELLNCTGYDWSRYDLSGEGHTGADWGSKFNLDINKPAEWTYVTAPHDPDMSFNEHCTTDLQVLCYYAYSPLYQGSTEERDDLLEGFCGGQKSWTAYPTPTSITELHSYLNQRPFYLYAKVNRQGIYAAEPYLAGPNIYGILISRIDTEGATTITQIQSPPFSLAVSDFYIDNIGNIILIYLSSAYNDVDGYSSSLVARKYSLENGWDEAPNVLWSFTRPIGRVYYYESDGPTDIAVDECGNAISTWVTRHTNVLEYDPSSIWSTYYKVHAIRYDVNLGWEEPVQIALEDPEWIQGPGTYHPEIWQAGDTLPRVAMNSKGDAVLVWTGYRAANQTRAVRAKVYKVGSGWGETQRIAAPGMLSDELLDIVMDRSGNAIVTSYSNGGGTRVTHYDIRNGWQPSFIIADNLGLNYGRAGYAYRISMDECGNAMIVYPHVTGDPYFEGQVSLRSNRYSVDDGWDSEATVIDAQFGVIFRTYFCQMINDEEICTPYSAYEGKYFNEFALYGGGNATLITYMHNNTSELISVSARQHRPGLGWDDSASTFYLNEPFEPLGLLRNRHDLGTPRRIALIDKYGNATSFWSDYLNNNYFTTEFK